MKNQQVTKFETITLGGGCFWCLEAVFAELDGVLAVHSGYTGGEVESPGYHAVCSGSTGHAEAVRIEFDPERIDYRTLLDVFFAIHDPTTLNRQGYDIGSQYRSAIFCHDAIQRRDAEAAIAELEASGSLADPVVTVVEAAGPFWPAESEHDGYYARHPTQPYCQAIIAPKLAKLRQHFTARLKPGNPDGGRHAT